MAGMSDVEVQGQIRHMIAFIEQEASEKVEEIDSKAEEEFNLEKGRLVQNARMKIIDHYDKKIKQVELQKKIQQSNLLNQSRLQVLKHKEKLVQETLDEVRNNAKRMPSSDIAKYKVTMKQLVLQALMRLLETKVTVQVKQEDLSLIKSIAPEIQDEYKKMTKNRFTIQLNIDENNFLSSDIIGGVVIKAQNDKISINNTLDERLKHIAIQQQPKIREMLFGPNPNRKFKD